MQPAPYILYVIPGPTCEPVIRLAAQYGPSVFQLVDVTQPQSRPPNLPGVPYMISRTGNCQPLQGPQIVQWLQQATRGNTQTYAATAPIDAGPTAMTGRMTGNLSYVGAGNESVTASLYNRDTKVSESDIEAYARLRERKAGPRQYAAIGKSVIDGAQVTM